MTNEENLDKSKESSAYTRLYLLKWCGRAAFFHELNPLGYQNIQFLGDQKAALKEIQAEKHKQCHIFEQICMLLYNKTWRANYFDDNAFNYLHRRRGEKTKYAAFTRWLLPHSWGYWVSQGTQNYQFFLMLDHDMLVLKVTRLSWWIAWHLSQSHFAGSLKLIS